MKYLVITIGIIASVTFGLILFGGERAGTALAATVHKSPQCGCCVQYIAYLRSHGVKVDVETTDEMQSVKDEYGVPHDMQSCHTTIIGGYFIEGHVPFDAVSKLLAENPAIDGIALPNMPAGSPGMPGIKDGLFDIYQVSEEVFDVFVSI